MEYTSDVILTLFKEDYRRLDREARDSGRRSFVQFLNRGKLYNSKVDPRLVYLIWRSVKWHKKNVNVSFVESFLEEYKIPYHFLRVGICGGADVEERSFRLDEESTFSYYSCPIAVTTIHFFNLVGF